MRNTFISLVADGPDGFEYRTPSKRDLLGSCVALYSDSIDRALALHAEFRPRVRGLIITLSEAPEHTHLGPGLWHLGVRTQDLPGLRERARCLLDVLWAGHETWDENRNLHVEVERRRVAQEQTRRSYNDNSQRLVARVEDLRREIAARERAEEEKLALERQLLHAQKLESLGVLAGGIAHDFNNIVTAILGNADLASHELSEDSAAYDHLKEIEKASIRAAELARQMLAYSGKGRFVVEPIELSELVADMENLLKVSVSKKATLHLELAAGLPHLDGDATQLRQVVLNLITNASDALGDSSGTITLSTGSMTSHAAHADKASAILGADVDTSGPAGPYVYFQVTDTGCGMDTATQKRIFDPFFSTKFTGRGLGMSAVLGIVRGHKGALKVLSEVGRGTTFKVLFPATDFTENQALPPSDIDARKLTWQGKGLALVVDDEATVRDVAQQMLERMGFAVVAAADGYDALDLIRSHKNEITFVLLDLTMPRMGGEEALRHMRDMRPDLPVLLCSGYDGQATTERFSGKGQAGFIQKPFTIASLGQALVQLVPELSDHNGASAKHD